MSQPELAERAGVSQSYISALERGARRNCSWDVLTALARGLDYPLESLLRESEIIPAPSGDAERDRLILEGMIAADELPSDVLASEMERLRILAEHYRRQRVRQES